MDKFDIGLYLILGGLFLLIIFSFVGQELTKVKSDALPCYDSQDNLIQGLNCEGYGYPPIPLEQQLIVYLIPFLMIIVGIIFLFIGIDKVMYRRSI